MLSAGPITINAGVTLTIPGWFYLYGGLNYESIKRKWNSSIIQCCWFIFTSGTGILFKLLLQWLPGAVAIFYCLEQVDTGLKIMFNYHNK